MYVKKLFIQNFRGIRKMELELNKRMNVFIGINGAGKTTILDALAMSLSWWDACWQKRKSPERWMGEPLQFYDITNGENFAACTVELSLDDSRSKDNNPYWTVTTDRKVGQQNYNDLIVEPQFGLLRQTVAELLDQEDLYLPPPAVYCPIDRIDGYFKDSSEIPNSTLNEILAMRAPAFETLKMLFPSYLDKKEYYTTSIRIRSNYRKFLEWMNELQKKENIKLRELQELGQDVSEPSSYQSPELIAVKRAWSDLYSNAISNFIIKEHTNPTIGSGLYLSCRKSGVAIIDKQLSGGEKALLALVGGLAQHYTDRDGGLEKPGIVLIDEVELHLHPQWQRTVLPKLLDIFPNTQFIVSTHSPQIIGELPSEYVIRLEETESGIVAIPANGETFGMTSNMILQTQMDSTERNQTVQDMLDEAFQAVEYGNLDRAKEIKTELEKTAKDIPELLRLDMRISLKETTGK